MLRKNLFSLGAKLFHLPGAILLLFYFLGVIYLALPGPAIPVLPDSFRSTEPGDTWQFPGIWAYYTNLPRKTVVDFFKEGYAKSWLWGLPLAVVKLNHPPEYCQEKIRDTQRFSFCEELIQPLRESFFVSGWTPGEDKIYLEKFQSPAPELMVEGQPYKSKVILYHVESPIWARILIWTGIVVGSVFLGLALRSIILSPWLKKI